MRLVCITHAARVQLGFLTTSQSEMGGEAPCRAALLLLEYWEDDWTSDEIWKLLPGHQNGY